MLRKINPIRFNGLTRNKRDKEQRATPSFRRGPKSSSQSVQIVEVACLTTPEPEIRRA